MVRRVVCRSLQPYETLEAADGLRALDMLREWRPTVAILDWMMPGLSGLEVCQAARSDPTTARTIFIMMTARREQDSEEQARLAGVSYFIRKPVMPRELFDLVTPLLSNPAPSRDATSEPGGGVRTRYKVKSDLARNRLMIRVGGRLNEAALSAIMAEAGGELAHLAPGYAVWVDLRGTELGGHALDVPMQQFYALVASTSPSKVGTLVDDVSAQMRVARTSGQADIADLAQARVFTDESEWLQFLR